MRASVFRAMKLTLRILAVLAVLAASVALGWKPASNAGVKRSSVTAVAGARTGGHRADGHDDDDIVESGFAAPERRQIDGAAAPELNPETARLSPVAILSSKHLTGRGIRPSGEHRSTTDRPPRA